MRAQLKYPQLLLAEWANKRFPLSVNSYQRLSNQSVKIFNTGLTINEVNFDVIR